MKETVLILGARGRLGLHLTPFLKSDGKYSVVTHSQTQDADEISDLNDLPASRALLDKVRPDFIINLTALTDVDLCQSERALAYKLNVNPVKNLVRALGFGATRTKLVQISTDQIYDKNLSTEDDVLVTNHYGLTKYIADEIVDTAQGLVLRTNFFGTGTASKPGLSEWVLKSLKDKKPIQGFNDVYFSPLHVSTLVTEVRNSMENFRPGIFNLGSRDGLSKYDFIVQLGKTFELDVTGVQPLSYKDSKMTTPRPSDMRMDVSKYERTFGRKLPTLAEEILKC